MSPRIPGGIGSHLNFCTDFTGFGYLFEDDDMVPSSLETMVTLAKSSIASTAFSSYLQQQLDQCLPQQ